MVARGSATRRAPACVQVEMLRITLCEWLPLVPVIVIRAGERRCPTLVVVSVRVEVDVVGLGEKEIDMPRGKELLVSAT